MKARSVFAVVLLGLFLAATAQGQSPMLGSVNPIPSPLFDGSYSDNQLFAENVYTWLAAPCDAGNGGTETLQYDDGTPYYVFSVPDYWDMGIDLLNVRFTPAEPCTLKAALFLFNGFSGDPGLRVRVWNDANGLPGAVLATLDIPTSSIVVSPVWQEVDLSSQNIIIDPAADFHIGYTIINREVGDSLVIFSDDGAPIGTEHRSSWYWYGRWETLYSAYGESSDLNFMIRAVVSYIQAPVLGVDVTAGSDASGVAGSDVLVTFTILNTGEAPDTYDVTVTDTKGWDLSPAGFDLVLEPDADTLVTITVLIPPGMPIGTADTITLNSTSQTVPSVTDSDELTVVVVRPSVGNPNVIAGEDTSGAPGSGVTVYFDLSNAFDAGSDSFQVAVTDDKGWNLSPDLFAVALAYGADTSLAIAVGIPEIAVEGEIDVVTLTAISQTDPGVRDSDSLSITVVGPSATIDAYDAVGLPGSTGNAVDIGLENNVTVSRIEFIITDVPNWLTASNVLTTARSSGLSADFSDTSGRVHVVLDGLGVGAIAPGSGPISQIAYAVYDTAVMGESVALEISDAFVSDEDGDSIPVFTASGTFVIGSYKGDLNADGEINSMDIVICANIILRRIVPTSYQQWAGDLNDDGEINVLDCILIVNTILGSPIACKATDAIAMVEISETFTVENDRVSIPLLLNSEVSVVGAQLRLRYNPSMLIPDMPQPPDGNPDMTVLSHTRDGELIVLLYSLKGETIFSGKGTLVTVPFKIVKQGNSGGRVHIEDIILASDDGRAVTTVISQRVVAIERVIPEEYTLFQNYPNPFNSGTAIQFAIPSGLGSHAFLKIYNTLGHVVRTLLDEKKGPGHYTVRWDGKDSFGKEVASGVYFYRLKAGEYVSTKRMLVIK